MFASRDTRVGRAGALEVAFTDRHGGVSPPPFDSLDLGEHGADGTVREANFALLREALDVRSIATMGQVHGGEVCIVSTPSSDPPRCDALVTSQVGIALCARVADCVPVVLTDSDAGVVAVAHAGRQGLVAGVVGNTVDAMRRLGARDVEGWIGPHVCGGCYEVPAQMQVDVAAVAPTSYCCTTWGTPSLDLGAAVAAQLAAAGCAVNDRGRCTRESDDLYSYRRDGARSGRAAGLVVLRGGSDG